ncbi:Holliday junction branch migration protein RuvA [Candidatus Kinetoplastidibacterium crithidiae]|uniref:Holliday junction branch migration complex subunit RuvA n=1 Tax=Candidatus Kinetoplastidibacterium crithidiae TCC036E TaxID=1208918 RepID=M1L5A9_9PROT|nr:Holliday junction branch migration protein RuvA [Candidatus Kinetoplastibacterium crithidii]AFZ82516.1 holliday junction DNA helicase RuvA [Candidatus Kinetoplastibacterium crithidii (ex Angomonas deanei ATCC 30255)]AGF47823.1 holliday junction DNA helicase RuvA [Candidatus Kinetoplastibacterium crithidii TCC036E]
MIERISGLLLETWSNSICVDVHGVGYEIEIPTSLLTKLPKIGEKVTLFTYLVIREDAHILFGFDNQQDRVIFKSLMKTNGIGIRTALSILSNMTVKEIISAITLQDTSILTKIPGIGQKTAERLILEMRDKIKSSHIEDNFCESGKKTDIIEAMTSLGYSSKEIMSIINLLPDQLTLPETIKYALRLLNKS